MSKDTLKNIFHVYCFYTVRLQGDTEPRMRRNKLNYDNPIQNYYESFIDCLRGFCEVRSDVSLYSFYQFVVDAVNSLNKQERKLIYERYLYKDHYKSDRQHYLAMDITPQNYKKQMDPVRRKLIKNLGIEDLQLNIPDWMKR
ncbi:hypothetical protein BCJMU51_p408 (plasmid) [Bacillus cereus]|uniref:hypothetical protein n=1 Tax=Bacillus cereus TaxID=1396 RepID=UPI001F3F2F32|nr:hypothetical protein [Bacillus cereus]BCC03730.1 hypothetical protein BCM0057_p208 [Bacillus cereus]BCC27250.1 hypothetical protein BCM0079_p206 [Bacillus cereus]BCC38797.1 hypothetical protein BCM0105_p206 [Bacillus cereus]BCC38814.1 hypothetical protein BCM0105_p308 [Bacillus cereus]BCC74280.1 hypothetical protein BCJMU51_p408 [Bacillus cereus]